MLPMQAQTYETLAHLGPIWSAVLAGFAIILWDGVYITPSGERYLLDQMPTHQHLNPGVN